MIVSKRLVSLLVVALATMAFAGASSAMAETTALCNVDPGEGAFESCPAGQTIGHIHGATVEKAAILATPEVKCNVLFLGETSGLSSPLYIEGNFTYTNCGVGCSVEEVGGPGLFEVLKTGHDKATATLEWEVHVNCFGINCIYNGEELKGVFKGSLLPFVEEGEFGNGTLTKVGGTFCPTAAKLDLWLVSLSEFSVTR